MFDEITLDLHDNSQFDIDYLKDHGLVENISDGIIFCSGLDDGFYNEVVIIDDRFRGIIMELGEDMVGIGVFEDTTEIIEGMTVRRVNEVVNFRLPEVVAGQVLNPFGESLYEDNPAQSAGEIKRAPLFSTAPQIMTIDSVTRPLATGILLIDALLPIGKGQRQLILGDRQIGKTQIALDTIINQKGRDVHCIYVSIGLKMHYITDVIDRLRNHDALKYTTIVATTSSDSITSQYLTPYAGMALAESLMAQGKDVLIVLDNLTKHADIYRTISLLFNRPPGREAYPGDIFYVHSSLLERAVQMSQESGGGSITALPIIETLSNDVTAYVPTNVISITDGQLLLKADLFHAGQKPAVDIGFSVSRIGGDAQSPIIRKLSKGLNLILSQYYELKELLVFGNALDEQNEEIVNKGRVLLELFKQFESSPISTGEMAALLFVFHQNCINQLPNALVITFKQEFLRRLTESELTAVLDQLILEASALPEETEQQLLELSADIIEALA